jgi:peptidoglycan/LPS O-acetylase OafA/YrhL
MMNYVGVLSYSIYLWQQFFLSGTGDWFTLFPQNVVLALLTAMGSYYFIERHFLKLKDKFSISAVPPPNRKE